MTKKKTTQKAIKPRTSKREREIIKRMGGPAKLVERLRIRNRGRGN